MLRGQSMLVGTWQIHYALRRLGEVGEVQAQHGLGRLLDRVYRGAIAEVFAVPKGGVEAHRQIIRHKAVAYDRLLYRSLLDPLAPERRQVFIRGLSLASEVAQYFNDFNDQSDDAARGQPNLMACQGMDEGRFWRMCFELVTELESLESQLQPAEWDALLAMMYEVISAADHLWSRA